MTLLELVLGLALAAASAHQTSEQPALVFEGVSVLTMEGENLLRGQTVVVTGDRITALGPSDRVVPPEGARVVDGKGRFLMPGLCDMHMHLSDPRDGLLYLVNGVTTIRNLSGQTYHLDLAEAFRRGTWLGPTLVSSGPAVHLGESATESEAAELVARHREQGFASVKLYGRMSLEQYRAMTAASRELDMPLVGHVPRNLTLEEVLQVGGHREISHAEEMLYSFFDRRDQPAFDVMLDCVELLAESGAYVTPTITVYREILPQVTGLERVLERPEMRFLPPLGHLVFGPLNKYGDFDEADIAWLEAGGETLGLLTLALHETGVPLLLGTDAMNPSVIPGFSIHDELRELVGAGLTPFEAIASGTTTAAAFWGLEEEVGRVAVGQRADLLLLEADPLDDIAHVRQIAGVVVRGRWLPQDQLRSALEQQVAGYEAERALMPSADPSDPGPLLEALAQADVQPPEAFFLSVVSMYCRKGAFAAATAVLDAALEIHPRSVLLHNQKAEDLEARGSLEGAKKHYERALELDPGNAVARRAMTNSFPAPSSFR